MTKRKPSVNPKGTVFRAVPVWLVPKAHFSGSINSREYHRHQQFGTYTRDMKHLLRVMDAYMKSDFRVTFETYWEDGIEFANMECRP